VIAAAASGAHLGASAAMMTAAPTARFGIGAMRQVSTAAQAVAGSRQAKNNDSLEKASAAIRPASKERTP
jgi:hypothetical protein